MNPNVIPISSSHEKVPDVPESSLGGFAVSPRFRRGARLGAFGQLLCSNGASRGTWMRGGDQLLHHGGRDVDAWRLDAIGMTSWED